uniref:Uncharacterized protein n=1 Tax=Rhizophora mucronata TaxID=61149 RepID=A0A2P2Q9N8_RHIMU
MLILFAIDSSFHIYQLINSSMKDCLASLRQVPTALDCIVIPISVFVSFS